MSPTLPERFEAPPASVYLLGAPRSLTPWYRLYEARKVFFNYRYDDRRLYEAAEDEWIDCLIRFPPESASPDPSAADAHHWLLQYEATQVLPAPAPWFPEPIDWLDNTARPPSAEGAASDWLPPAVVMSRPHGRLLRDWRLATPPLTPACLHVALEVLAMLDMLHARGQLVAALSPDDFLIDDAGRPSFLATDRVLPLQHVRQLRGLFPPARYPAAFSAPEVSDPARPLDARSDLYAWAALCCFLITAQEPSTTAPEVASPTETSDHSSWALSASGCQQVESSLLEAARSHPGRIPPLSRKHRPWSGPDLAADWLAGLKRCLAPDPAARPESIAQLRGTPPPTHKPSPLANLPRLIRGLFTGPRAT